MQLKIYEFSIYRVVLPKNSIKKIYLYIVHILIVLLTSSRGKKIRMNIKIFQEATFQYILLSKGLKWDLEGGGTLPLGMGNLPTNYKKM